MASAIAHPSYTLRESSRVHFYPLFLRAPEGDQQEWRVGVEKSALALELPVEGVRAIHYLQTGQSMTEVAALLQQEFDEAIDLVELVEGLAELGLVQSIDEYQFVPPERIGQKWLQRIPPAAVGWLYSRPALLVCTVLLLLGPLLLIFQPTLRPRAQDLLWSPSYTLNLLVLLVLEPALILKHELGHLLAARAKGLPAELTFGHRFFYLVAVSRIGEIWKRSRFERLLIYSAGMVSNGIAASLCLLLLFAASHAFLLLPAPLVALLRLIPLWEYLGIAWQFQIFFKTDVYHIFTELTRRHDLPEQSVALLRSWWQAIFLRIRHQLYHQAASSDLLTRGYTALSVVGMSASCLWFIWYGLPATFIALQGEITLLVTSIPAKHVLALLDGVIALGLQLLWLLLLGWSIARKYLKRSPAQT